MRRFPRMLAAAFLCGSLALMGFQSTYASSSTREQLDNANSEVNSLQSEVNSTQNKLDTAEEDLTNIIAKISKLESDMENKQVEIEETTEELNAAKQNMREQYAAMKVRIRYMYENNGQSLLA